jgi:hypothetical protein
MKGSRLWRSVYCKRGVQTLNYPPIQGQAEQPSQGPWRAATRVTAIGMGIGMCIAASAVSSAKSNQVPGRGRTPPLCYLLWATGSPRASGKGRSVPREQMLSPARGVVVVFEVGPLGPATSPRGASEGSVSCIPEYEAMPAITVPPGPPARPRASPATSELSRSKQDEFGLPRHPFGIIRRGGAP